MRVNLLGGLWPFNHSGAAHDAVAGVIFLPALCVAWFRIKAPAVRGEVFAAAHSS
jgi:hypothetical protein